MFDELEPPLTLKTWTHWCGQRLCSQGLVLPGVWRICTFDFHDKGCCWKEEGCRLSKSCSCTSTGVRSTAKSVRPPNFESHSWHTTCGITRTWDVWHESRHIGDCIWKLDVPRNSDPCKIAFSPCLWTSFSQVFECLIGLICTYSSKSPRPWIWRFPSLSLSQGHFAMLGTLPLANQVDCVPFLNWQVMFIYIVSTLNCSPGAWIAMTLSCSAHHSILQSIQLCQEPLLHDLTARNRPRHSQQARTSPPWPKSTANTGPSPQASKCKYKEPSLESEKNKPKSIKELQNIKGYQWDLSSDIGWLDH